MLPGGADAGYRLMLRTGGGQPVRRVEVWYDGVRVDGFGDLGLPVSSGSVTATLSSQVTRTVSLATRGASLFPWSSGDLLDPLGAELRIYAGWRSGAAAPRMWPVFRGPVVSCAIGTDSPAVSIEGSDLAEPILADNFPSPRTPVAGRLVSTEFVDLINDTHPGATFAGIDETYATVPQATWESSRSGALDELAKVAGSHWYSLADGAFTMRRIPWAQPTLGDPVATLTNPGELLRARVETGRDGVYNQVALVGEAKDGSAPVYGLAADQSPTSRLRVDGPLGRRVLVSDEALVSAAQADSLARQRLIRARTQVMLWSAEIVADPSLELGDVCTLVAMGRRVNRVLTGFTLPLTGEMRMSTSWRGAGELDD